MRFTSFLTAGILLFAVHPSLAAEKDAAQIIYDSLEETAKREFEKLNDALSSDQRSAKGAGKSVQPSLVDDADRISRMFLYNKAVINARCQAGEMSKKVFDTSAATECAVAKQAEIGRYMKLMEYVPALNSQKVLQCEMKSREFYNEDRFPPYEFLKRHGGPRLYDFKLLNDCIIGTAKN
jgi:hypothetical protein